MEKKLVGLVFIALLAGLGGGYGLGYTAYHPQNQSIQEADTRSYVTSLQNELTLLSSQAANLNSTVEEIESKTWYRSLLFEENGIGLSVTFFSENFEIKGDWIRIRWIAEASYTPLADFLESWITISVRFSNGTEYTHRKTFVGTFSSMATDMDITPEEYYLTITIGYAISKKTVVVWDYH